MDNMEVRQMFNSIYNHPLLVNANSEEPEIDFFWIQSAEDRAYSQLVDSIEIKKASLAFPTIDQAYLKLMVILALDNTVAEVLDNVTHKLVPKAIAIVNSFILNTCDDDFELTALESYDVLGSWDQAQLPVLGKKISPDRNKQPCKLLFSILIMNYNSAL